MDLLAKCNDIVHQSHLHSKEKTVEQHMLKSFSGEEGSYLQQKILGMHQMLRSIKQHKFCERFSKMFCGFNRDKYSEPEYAQKFESVEFSEYSPIMESHNEFELAMNVNYVMRYGLLDSYLSHEQVLLQGQAFHVDMKPIEADLPENMKALG